MVQIKPIVADRIRLAKATRAAWQKQNDLWLESQALQRQVDAIPQGIKNRDLTRRLRDATTAHSMALDEYHRLKRQLDQADQRLDQAKVQIAKDIKVPRRFRHASMIWIQLVVDGSLNVFFGFKKRLKKHTRHGHYHVDRDGRVTYARNPWDKHGPQNFRLPMQPCGSV